MTTEPVIFYYCEEGTYQIPLIKVAEDRANYYAKQQDLEDDFNYDDEIKAVMDDYEEGIDWLMNNTNFEDWADVAVLVEGPSISKYDYWEDIDSFSYGYRKVK